jgi:hypothetical protein
MYAFEAGGDLEIESDDGRTRQLRSIIYQSGLEGEWSGNRGGITGLPWRKFPAAFLALDPYWYDVEPSSIAIAPPEGDTAYDDPIDYDIERPYNGASAAGINGDVGYDDPIDYDSAIGYDGGAIIEIPVESQLGVWPIITVHGPANYVQIRNLTTGEVVETNPGVTIPYDRELVVITRPEDRTILIAGVEAWDQVTAESTATMMLSAGRLEGLVDEDGVFVRDELGRIILTEGFPDRLSILVTGTASPTYVRVAWEERWLTP